MTHPIQIEEIDSVVKEITDQLFMWSHTNLTPESLREKMSPIIKESLTSLLVNLRGQIEAKMDGAPMSDYENGYDGGLEDAKQILTNAINGNKE